MQAGTLFLCGLKRNRIRRKIVQSRVKSHTILLYFLPKSKKSVMQIVGNQV